MENSLYIYHMVVPLRYYTYDLHSEKKDSEYVMGLKQDMDWNVTRIVEQPIPDTNQIFRREEPVHIHLFCENDVEHEEIPADFFEVEITNLVAPDQDEARVFVKPYLYRICRTLSFFLSQNNCNKHSYQPRVETDVEHAVWGRSVYEPFETLLQKKEDFVETTLVDGKKYQVITMESAPIVISTSLYTKIYGRMPTDDFLLYVECDDTDLNYMLDEFYLALGQENRYSKFFHLFSIIEFVEKRYEDHNGANKLLASDEIEAITKAVMDISTMVDREKRNRVCGALKQTLGNLTDIGRKEKLVHILHQMGIREIKNCGTEFEIDDKTIGKLISLRNKCYHGDRKKADHSYINIDLAVTQLMYLCEQIIIKQMKSTHERMV